MKKNIIIPTVALFVICLVSTLLLALANNVTAPMIEEIAAQTEVESRKTVLSTATEFKDEKSGDIAYAAGYNDKNELQGYVFITTTKSYGGDLQVMTGVDTEGKVTGTEILLISDTAGLGMNAQKQDFKDRFVGLVKGLTIQKNTADPANNEVLALTGATITSNAVALAVNEALENYEAVTGNGGAN